MEKEKLESLLIDYIDGNLNDADHSMVGKELAQSEEAVKLYQQLSELLRAMENTKPIKPSNSLKSHFEKSLIDYSKSTDDTNHSKQIFFQPWVLRVAAGIVLVIVGIVIGNWINTNRKNNRELARLMEEVENNKKMMLAMLENQQSASQRVMGASVAYELNQADDEIVTVLVKVMNEDPNTNVRLTALEALAKFYHQTRVRSALLIALPAQKDPMVQIALIRLLVQMKEKQVVNELQKITRDESVMKAVKDEAHSGILKLS